jgi:hypothetical protein
MGMKVVVAFKAPLEPMVRQIKKLSWMWLV